MTAIERTRLAMRGEPVDRLPTFPIMLATACRLLGVPQREFNRDPRTLARTLLAARELCGFDGIYVSRDNWVCHEALGGRLTFPQDDESYATECILGSVRDCHRLSVPDPTKAAGMSTVLAAAREVTTAAGDRFYVQANVDVGPFSMAAVLRGAQAWLLDLSTESPGAINEVLEFCTEVAIAYGKAMIETGVHAIQFGEATASLISPSFFQAFALPWIRQLLESLAGRGADLWLHICGKTSHILPLLRGLPLHGLEVDAAVPLAAARSLLGERIAIKGNLDTTLLLRGSAEEVRRASRHLLRDSGLSSGLIFSPGCAAPRGTPLENLRAMVEAVEEQSAEPTQRFPASQGRT